MNEETAPATTAETKYNMVVTATCGVIALLLLHVGFLTSVGIMVLIGTALVVATNAKPDNALKYFVRMYSKLIATVALGIVIFLMANLVISAPAIQISGWLRHGADLGDVSHVNKWLLLEVLFVATAGFTAYNAMYAKEGGKVKTGWLKTAAILLMAITLWQLKAPETPWGRYANAQMQIWEQQLAQKAVAKEALVAGPERRVTVASTAYRLANGELESINSHVAAGRVVVPTGKIHISPLGFKYIEVVVPTKNGDFLKGDRVLIDARALPESPAT